MLTWLWSCICVGKLLFLPFTFTISLIFLRSSWTMEIKNLSSNLFFRLYYYYFSSFSYHNRIASLVNCSMSTIERFYFSFFKTQEERRRLWLLTWTLNNKQKWKNFCVLIANHLCWIFIEIFISSLQSNLTIRFFDCVIIILIFYPTSARNHLSVRYYCCKGFFHFFEKLLFLS